MTRAGRLCTLKPQVWDTLGSVELDESWPSMQHHSNTIVISFFIMFGSDYVERETPNNVAVT